MPGFVVGVLLLPWVNPLPSPGLLLALFSLLWLLRRPLRQRPWPAALALGFAWAWGQGYWALQNALPPHLEGLDLVLHGTVVGLPAAQGPGMRFEFVGAVVAPEGADYRGRFRLTWYRDAPELEAGESWRLKVRLKAPHGFANPGGFDYEGWLFRQGIRATGYVRTDPENRRLDGAEIGLDRLRQNIRDRLAAVLPQGVSAGLIPALVLGDRAAMEREHWEVLTRTGTNHLIAISGLHVGIIAGLAFFLVRWFWRRFPFLCQWLAAQRAAAVAGMFCAAGYAALAGFSVSTQRALVMLAVVFGALLLRRTPRPFGALLVALAAVLAVDPMASLSPGFWLSFGAVAALLYGMGRRVGQGGNLWRWGRAQWVVALGLLPLLLLLFGRASLIAPAVNLIAIPLFSLLLPLVLVAALLALVFAATLPLTVAAWLLEQGYAGLDWLAGLSWAALSLPDKPFWVWLAAFAGTVVLLAPRGLPGRWTGAPMLLPLLLVNPVAPPHGAFLFTLLDVGQGLAVVVQTRNHLLVYDTGPSFPSGFNTGEAVLAPFLRARGLDSIDRLVVSHADIDHAGGVAALLARVSAAEVLSGEPDEIEAADAAPCTAGMRWRWDGVEFEFLHPSFPLSADGNDRSCVLQVRNRAGAVLLPGDAGSKVEAALVRRYGERLRSWALVAGHHGSNTSTSAALLDAVRPTLVLYSAGYRNRYGFPRSEVRARVAAAGARELDTVRSGALEFLFPAAGAPQGPTAFRPAQARYWTHQP